MTDPVCPCGQRTALECLGDDCVQEGPMRESITPPAPPVESDVRVSVCPLCEGSGKGEACEHCQGVGATCGTPFPPIGGWTPNTFAAALAHARAEAKREAVEEIVKILNFTQSFDARDWAKAFVETVREHPDVPLSEGAMIGWFANAIMRGYDEAGRGVERRVAEVEARYAPLVQAVREWQEAYRADPLSDDAGIRYGKARQALLALPLPEAGK